jgi:hypothetical protein
VVANSEAAIPVSDVMSAILMGAPAAETELAGITTMAERPATPAITETAALTRRFFTEPPREVIECAD